MPFSVLFFNFKGGWNIVKIILSWVTSCKNFGFLFLLVQKLKKRTIDGPYDFKVSLASSFHKPKSSFKLTVMKMQKVHYYLKHLLSWKLKALANSISWCPNRIQRSLPPLKSGDGVKSNPVHPGLFSHSFEQFSNVSKPSSFGEKQNI